jgi:hypothetical protein
MHKKVHQCAQLESSWRLGLLRETAVQIEQMHFEQQRQAHASLSSTCFPVKFRHQGRRQQPTPYDCSAEAEANPHNILEVLALAENAQHLRKTGAGVDQTCPTQKISSVEVF